jgi:hypothetical protein
LAGVSLQSRPKPSVAARDASDEEVNSVTTSESQRARDAAIVEAQRILRDRLDEEQDTVALAEAVVGLWDDLQSIRESLPALMKVDADEFTRLVMENSDLRERQAKLVEWCKSIMHPITRTTDDGGVETGTEFRLNVWHCTWCEETGPATDGIHTDARAHDRACKSHPAVIENERLRALVDDLRKRSNG